MAKVTAAQTSLLVAIVAAMGNTDAPFMFVTPGDAKNLIAEGLVEQNSEITDGDKLATRATEKGIALANEGNNSSVTDTTTTTAAKPTFEIEDGVAKPEGRAPRASNIYPFETMNVGQSFHVPATDEKPNPAKSLASTVSSANKRFTKTDNRKFSVKAVGEGDSKGKGARVWRDA